MRFVGRVAIYVLGNTGGSNVSMFRKMPIDPGLLSVMSHGGHAP